MLAALALMAFTMTAAALAVAVATTAFAVTVTAFALTLSMVLAIALAVIAVAAATATAGAAYLLIHGIGNFFIGRGAALLDSNAKVLVHNIEHFVELLTSLEESLANGVINHVLTQTIEGGDFLLRGGHTLHVLVAEFLTILVDLAEKVSGFGVLVEKADTSTGGNNLLALSNGIGQLGGELHKFRRKGCI